MPFFHHKRNALVALAGLLAWLAPAGATESAWVINKNSIYAEMTPYFAAYAEDTARIQELSLLNRLEIGWLENSALILSWPFYTLDKQGGALAGPTGSLTNNGPGDLYLGSHLQVIQYPLALTFKGQVKIPTGYDIEMQPGIGDGQLDLELGGLIGYHFDEIPAYIQGSLGYRYRLPYPAKHPLVLQAKNRGETLTRPADLVLTSLEAGLWLTPSLLAAVSLQGDFALNQPDSLARSGLALRPLVAYRVNEYVDLSLALEQMLWSVNRPFSTGVALGAHFHYDTHLPLATGIRGH